MVMFPYASYCNRFTNLVDKIYLAIYRTKITRFCNISVHTFCVLYNHYRVLYYLYKKHAAEIEISAACFLTI